MDNKPESLKVSKASEIKKLAKARLEGELVSLPSGMVVKLRRPNLVPLLRANKIPTELFQALIDRESGRLPATREDMMRSLDAVDTVLIEAFVEPVMVANNPTDEQITPDDLTDEDRGFVYTYIQKGVTENKKFRINGTREDSGLNSEAVSEPKAE